MKYPIDLLWCETHSDVTSAKPQLNCFFELIIQSSVLLELFWWEPPPNKQTTLLLRRNVVSTWQLRIYCVLFVGELPFGFPLKRSAERSANSTHDLYSWSGRASYRGISCSLEAAGLNVIMIVLLWNLTGISAAFVSNSLSNFRAVGKD